MGAVVGSVQRRKPETNELADVQRKPLTDWSSRAAKRAPSGSIPGVPTGGGPPSETPNDG